MVIGRVGSYRNPGRSNIGRNGFSALERVEIAASASLFVER